MQLLNLCFTLVVSVNFDQGFYVFNESDEVVFVTVSLSRAVSHNISVNIVGGGS